MDTKMDQNHEKQPVMEKYKEEAAKRVRKPQDAMNQYTDPATSSRLAKFAEDPWVEDDMPNFSRFIRDGDETKILIIGAGFGGIFYAISFLKAGFSHANLLIVDSAGGFGGTWYWNRGPGLMCDVESYIYLPYLEEMNYMPKERYSSGEEIRQYINMIAEKYDLWKITGFGTSVEKLQWDNKSKTWLVSMTQKQGRTNDDLSLKIRADFVCHATGILNRPKLPAVPGLDVFEGSSFHTARWDYETTGGSPSNPHMNKLQDKRVAIVGTGATAIQAVPQLAKWAKHLYVVQRTPSSVAVRGQRSTDPETFDREIATEPGWQLKRLENFMDCTTGISPPPTKNLVNDGWTDFHASVVLIGTPEDLVDNTAESISASIKRMNEIDLPRQERIRQRVADIVKDAKVAENLQAWYPGWCKRPCFHDEYLPAFNQPNVTLLDTNGRSVEAATAKGIVVNDTEYPVDVLIWSTGFNANGTIGDPATRGAMEIIGKDGRSLNDMWTRETPRTLHGVISGGFPNLFFISGNQGGATIVFTYQMQQMALHAVHIVKAAMTRAGAFSQGRLNMKIAIEPSPAAIDTWELRIMQGQALKSAMMGCTPGFYNLEGLADQLSPEQRFKGAKFGPWGKGMSDFRHVLEEWRKEGTLAGLEVY